MVIAGHINLLLCHVQISFPPLNYSEDGWYFLPYIFSTFTKEEIYEFKVRQALESAQTNKFLLT